MQKTLMALGFLALSAVSSMTMAAGEVSLVKSYSQSSYYHGFSWENGHFEAQVDNLGYAKNVSVFYKKTDGTWADYPLSFERATGANKEIWSADFSIDYAGVSTLPTGPVVEFAVKYQVNGQTYWDNNASANYKLTRGAGSILGNGVNVSVTAFPSEIKLGTGGNSASNHITVRNIAPAKNVKVTYTTDNWATTKVANATFSSTWYYGYSNTPNPNPMGFEEWFFTLDLSTGTQVKYAVSYTVNGVTYWDNNNGLNFTANLNRQ